MSSMKSNRELSYSYVLMVQHLIERCLVMYMDREECVRALAKHARIKPVVTATVWRELEKENKEFFEAYTRQRIEYQSKALSCMLEKATAKLCAQKLDDYTPGTSTLSLQLRGSAALRELSAELSSAGGKEYGSGR
ncbi:hypothetical protein CBR_g70694 [Chara braunii]|uniref:Angiotensin-converting enzyme 2 n=1 Tax=Chara braunii TaxID=69332 RepID=A0A388K9W5_CHABU|nr:hypothetical protein CBR_g70694 [Chara braunii]|eukprot:GBG66816.1 hypothetical protein CBR_g70694 [Chara braunii]